MDVKWLLFVVKFISVFVEWGFVKVDIIINIPKKIMQVQNNEKQF